jgi:hypothetical protein
MAAPGALLAPKTGPFSAAPTAGLAPAATPWIVAHKGAAHGGDNALALRQVQSLNASWYYSWASAYTITTNPGFVPMVFSAKALLQSNAIGDVMRQLPQTRTYNLLGFNEPDHPAQSNMSVDQAIRLWPHLMSTGLRLGSPGTTNATGPWLDQFMTRASRAGLRVDFITVHRYASPDTDSFLAKLAEVHARFSMPIWVTEFAVADWSATPSRPSRYTGLQIRRFMRDSIAGMRAMPYVERFAWKTRGPFDPIMGASALYHSDGQLTATGRLYASL